MASYEPEESDPVPRTARIVSLMRLMCDRRYWKVADLARRLNVSRWTVYRDLSLLEGAPLYIPLERSCYGFRISPTWKL